MISTIASSGSKLGSTPNSKSFPELGPAAGAAPVPPSSSGMLALRSADRMGEEIRASERRWAPGATVRRCLSAITNNRRYSSYSWSDDKNSRIIRTIDIIHKSLQHPLSLPLLNPISKSHNIHRNIVLLQLLGQFHHGFFIAVLAVPWGGSDKDDNPLTEVFVLSMFQCKLGDGQSGRDVDLPTYFASGGVDTADYLPEIFCMCYEDFWSENGCGLGFQKSGGED